VNAYRIVQEALTNVLKHAGPTEVTVALDYGEDELRLEVRDRGRGSAQRPSPGYGLISMQQRARLLGGHLVAGPAQGGFTVIAWLPVADPDRQPLTEPDRSPRPDQQLVEGGVP
jgi:signal transduction histidine kinase